MIQQTMVCDVCAATTSKQWRTILASKGCVIVRSNIEKSLGNVQHLCCQRCVVVALDKELSTGCLSSKATQPDQLIAIDKEFSNRKY